MIHSKVCKNCHQNFSITESDTAFYKKIAVPEPTHCPDCRLQRRMAFRNERNLFKRQCDLCHKEIVSFFGADVPFPVYCSPCWWSDKWDPLEYSRDFDFSRPFFPQLKELFYVVPKTAFLQLANENSDFNSLLAYSKNTYMSPGSYNMEDCYYARKSQYCKDCLNSQSLFQCELISGSTNCRNCYGSYYLINCRNCSDCRYMADCSSCQYCFMCSGLNNKKFHIKNKPYSEAEYKKIVAAYLKRNPDDLAREFQEFNQTIPKKFQTQMNCENSSGDYLQNCKNTLESYDCFDIEDSKYLVECVTVKDSMDLCMHDKEIELCYEMSSGGESNFNTKFCFFSCAAPNSQYLYSCFYLSDSFGCDGFHAKQSHCILNKKYSKEEYAAMKARMIEHMKKAQEYGEFFPLELALHPYNVSVAADYFPLTKEEALAKNCVWQDKDPAHYQAATCVLPLSIEDVPDSITKEILACQAVKSDGQICGKNYRIIQQELNLSRKIGVPLSTFCPDCRQLALQKLKNTRKLWQRKCAKCGTGIETTYSPDRPKKVYCEKCYLAEVY